MTNPKSSLFAPDSGEIPISECQRSGPANPYWFAYIRSEKRTAAQLPLFSIRHGTIGYIPHKFLLHSFASPSACHNTVSNKNIGG